jgi:hypothetical protein
LKWDSNLKNYPVLAKYLKSFETKLRKRDGVKEDGLCPWFALSRPRPEAEKLFIAPKIVFPDISKESRFAIDATGFFPDATGFIIGAEDWFLLAVLNSSTAWQFFKEECAALGDRDDGGRLRLKLQYVEKLPIPNASAADRESIGELAKKVQALHGQRRKRVERFLGDLGLDPAQSTSRNPLEQPWNLSAAEFAKRAKRQPVKFHESARAETATLTEQIAKLESEIDARVATLYGL